MHDNAAGCSDVELVSLRTAGCDPDGDHHHHHHHLQQQPMKSRRHPSVEQVTQLLDVFSELILHADVVGNSPDSRV